MENEKKIEFLYNAISDAQDLIKYIESKTAIIIAILTGYIATFFFSLEKIIKYDEYWSCAFWICFLSFIISLSITLWIVGRLVFPIRNPIANIKINNSQISNIQYFLAKNLYHSKWAFPFFNSKRNKLEKDYSTYLTEIGSLSDEILIQSLIQELLKISYIRNIKNDRFRILVTFVIITSILFIVLLLLYHFQLQSMPNQSMNCIFIK